MPWHSDRPVKSVGALRGIIADRRLCRECRSAPSMLAPLRADEAVRDPWVAESRSE